MKILHKKDSSKKFKIRQKIDFPIIINDMKKNALDKEYIYYE